MELVSRREASAGASSSSTRVLQVLNTLSTRHTIHHGQRGYRGISHPSHCRWNKKEETQNSVCTDLSSEVIKKSTFSCSNDNRFDLTAASVDRARALSISECTSSVLRLPALHSKVTREQQYTNGIHTGDEAQPVLDDDLQLAYSDINDERCQTRSSYRTCAARAGETISAQTPG